jgi:gluconolactonase
MADAGTATRIELEVRDERLLDLVDEQAELECVATGFEFIEGPVWDAAAGCLVFSDVKGDARWRWRSDEGATKVSAPNRHGNGQTFDADGRLVVCEHDTSAIVRMDAGGTGASREVLADTYQGKGINSPNDVVVHSDGSIFFTDPPYGRTHAAVGIERPLELGFNGVFRWRAGELEVVADDFDRPNGLCFSPDESLLYVNDTPRKHIRVFDVPAEGDPWQPSRTFAEGIGDDTGGVDGMKCDERGTIWVTGPGGVWAIAPDGVVLGVVRVPERVGNLHWGGPDWSTLYFAASTSLYRMAVRVSGRREPFMGT